MPAGLLLVAHVVAIMGLIPAALLGLSGLAPWIGAVVLVAVVLWGWRWHVVLITAAGAVVIAPATVMVWITIAVNFAIEMLGWSVERLRRPGVPFPKPVPYRTDVTWR